MQIQTELAPNCLCAKSFSEPRKDKKSLRENLVLNRLFFFSSVLFNISYFFGGCVGWTGKLPYPFLLPPALEFFRAISVNLAFSWGIHPSKIDAWLSKSNWIFHLGVKSCLRLIFEYFFLIFQGWFSHVKFNIFLGRISLKLMVKSQTKKNFIKFCPHYAILFFPLFCRQTLIQSLFLSYTPVF